MSKQARIAVIGTGWWSTYTHIPGLLEHPEVELVALCDNDAVKLDAAARAFGNPRTYDDYHAILEHEALDGAVVATNHASHYPITRYCLEHGLHVMLEKPMTLHAADARHLVQLAEQHARALIIGYPFNYAPLALRAREILVSGRLGAIQLLTCAYATRVITLLRGDESQVDTSVFPVHGPGTVYSQPSLSGGGQGHLQVTHAGGLLFSISGLTAQTVQARMHNHGLAVDLVDAMVVEFEGGALGTIGSTGNTFVPRHDLHIHCEHGGIALDVVGETLTVRGAVEEQHTSGEHREYRRFAPLYDLVDVILGRGQGAPPHAGWRTVELLDAAYRSALRGGAPVGVAELYASPSPSPSPG